MPEFTCTTAAAALRRGELSPLDLVEHCLGRIDRFESQVHAWVMVDGAGARKEAQRLGEELARGYDRGPLHGIPIGIKDIIDVEGWPTLAGSPIRQGHRAARDAELVARLRKAGAIILGKTVTTEFASFDPPPTRNPWNLERTPGGSSSGSAAAVALGMCLAAVGSQTGGSITRPASFCGVAGCKPAHGMVSVDGVLPLAPTLDHPGPIARTVTDLKIMLAAMVDKPWTTGPNVPLKPALTFAGPLISETCDIEGMNPEILLAHLDMADDAIEPALKTLQVFDDTSPDSLGTQLALVASLSSSWKDSLRMHRRVMTYEGAQVHRDIFPSRRDQFGLHIAALLDEGLATSASDYAEAIRFREQFRDLVLRLLGPVDALVTMATVTAAPGLETTGDPRFNSPWSYAGLPTVSVPCGLTDEGLPVSLQFVGHPDHLDRLFAAARWCEQRLNFTALPPMLNL